MNWEAIGAIGEILGAFAVVATLAYLAVQVRSGKTTAAESERVRNQVINDYAQSLGCGRQDHG